MQCVNYNGPDALYSSREICFCCNYDVGLAIVDVTDKSNPITISVKTYENKQLTHQGWLSSDHKFFVFGDEEDEIKGAEATRTIVMNVESLASPIVAGFHFGPSGAIDRNLYIKYDAVYGDIV
jgi:choice-of-anchor B domain-containing protein